MRYCSVLFFLIWRYVKLKNQDSYDQPSFPPPVFGLVLHLHIFLYNKYLEQQVLFLKEHRLYIQNKINHVFFFVGGNQHEINNLKKYILIS